MKNQNQNASPVQSISNKQVKTTKYLLIDDDSVFQSIIRKAGSEAGMEFECVSSMKELSRLKSLEAYGAIFVDYDLGKNTGFEIAEMLYKKMKNMPLILVSTSNRPYQDQLGQLPNIVGFISKWSSVGEFIASANELLKASPKMVA